MKGLGKERRRRVKKEKDWSQTLTPSNGKETINKENDSHDK